MTTYLKRQSQRNYRPDLFDWCREQELRQTNPAARRIAERYGVTLSQAATIAGIGSAGFASAHPFAK
jgi:hypothetical protein